MTEWVVTLRNGQRKEIEAESFDVEEKWPPGAVVAVSFIGARDRLMRWPAEQVVLVQRRNGHHLEQVWPNT